MILRYEAKSCGLASCLQAGSLVPTGGFSCAGCFPVQVGYPVLLIRLKIPLAPMGALAPGSVHARPSAQAPIDASGHFLAHMSGTGGQQI